MTTEHNRVCPVTLANSLDSRFRRWLQNPHKILAPYVTEGMTAVDIGCGPGFFAIELARLVGPTGRVIAADLQQGMLDKVAEKVRGTDLAGRIGLVKCDSSSLNVTASADFVLAFYMVHEMPDQAAFFRQVFPLLRESGKLLIVEPRMFHVSRTQFGQTLRQAEAAAFCVREGPRLSMSWSAILTKGMAGIGPH